MVFVRTLELSKAMVRWITEHPRLSILNPGRMVGNQKAVIKGGRTLQHDTIGLSGL